MTPIKVGPYYPIIPALCYDPELKAVYERKRGQGKSYRQAVVHVARLLTYRLYAVWKRGTPYQKRP